MKFVQITSAVLITLIKPQCSYLKKKIIRFLHSFSLFFHLTNVDRPTLGPGVVPSVDTVGNTESLPSRDLPPTERERSSTAPRCDGCGPGRTRGSRARGSKLPATLGHQPPWGGTPEPRSEGGLAGLGEGAAGWGWRVLRQRTHLKHKLAGHPPNGCLPAFKPAPAYVQGESMPASSSKSSCPRLPCS